MGIICETAFEVTPKVGVVRAGILALPVSRRGLGPSSPTVLPGIAAGWPLACPLSRRLHLLKRKAQPGSRVAQFPVGFEEELCSSAWL